MEILEFEEIWMDPEGITLSETSQYKTNTVWSRLHGTLKKPKLTEAESSGVGVTAGWEVGELNILVEGYKFPGIRRTSSRSSVPHGD